ncbi:hypothetical protein R6Q57_017582 [Mikania cordata]
MNETGRPGQYGPSCSQSLAQRMFDRGLRRAVLDSTGRLRGVFLKKDIGEMTKKTLDNVWNTTRKVKEAVAGDEEKKYEVPPTDHFVDDLRKRAGGYDRRRNS